MKIPLPEKIEVGGQMIIREVSTKKITETWTILKIWEEDGILKIRDECKEHDIVEEGTYDMWANVFKLRWLDNGITKEAIYRKPFKWFEEHKQRMLDG
jgi:hypothetical protein